MLFIDTIGSKLKTPKAQFCFRSFIRIITLSQHSQSEVLLNTLFAPEVNFIEAGFCFANDSIYRTYLSCIISSTAIKIPVSSTFAKSAFIAVPKIFIVGESPIYAFTSGGMLSPTLRTSFLSIL